MNDLTENPVVVLLSEAIRTAQARGYSFDDIIPQLLGAAACGAIELQVPREVFAACAANMYDEAAKILAARGKPRPV